MHRKVLTQSFFQVMDGEPNVVNKVNFGILNVALGNKFQCNCVVLVFPFP